MPIKLDWVAVDAMGIFKPQFPVPVPRTVNSSEWVDSHCRTRAGEDNPRVSILVLNYNNTDDTLETLSSTERLDYENKNILLVDNGSETGVIESVRSVFSAIPILENGENLGYAGGNNAGIREILKTGPDYIFLLNNDVVVPPDGLTGLVEAMEEDECCAAIQPLVVYYSDPGMVWSAGTKFSLGYPILFRKNDRSFHRGTFPAPFGLVGCAVLFRVSSLEEIGLFDDSLFLMHEETDWCIRAKKKGYSLLVNTDVHVLHKISATLGPLSEKYLYYICRNWLIVSRKHFSRPLFAYVILTEFVIRFPYYAFILLKSGNIYRIRSYLRGLYHGLAGRLS